VTSGERFAQVVTDLQSPEQAIVNGAVRRAIDTGPTFGQHGGVRGPCLLTLIIAVGCGGPPAPTSLTTATSIPTAPIPPLAPVAADALRPVAAFASIADPGTRSQAIFLELGRVFRHPRCVNCHPVDDAPRQGDHHEAHDPPVVRGEADLGPDGMRCQTCHQERNDAMARVPGAPAWRLAPRTLGWIGKDSSAICASLVDPGRNGHRTLKRIVAHLSRDGVVGWGWTPGADRSRPPGSQDEAGLLAAAWVATGAVCPTAAQAKAADSEEGSR
jgi:hypothetical protein